MKKLSLLASVNKKIKYEKKRSTTGRVMSNNNHIKMSKNGVGTIYYAKRMLKMLKIDG